MDNKIFVKPASEDVLVRIEDASGFIPDEGLSVDNTRYYRRRINDGDLIIVEQAAAKTPAKKTGDKK